MKINPAYTMLVGRVLLGAIFLLSGFNKIMNPVGTQQYMTAMGMTWATSLFYLGAVVLEVAGGVSLMLGWWARLGAWALIAFMIPVTVMFHANFADQNQMIHFMKNLAMAGGLLYVTAFGAGRISVDGAIGGGEALAGVGQWSWDALGRRRTSA